LTVRGPAGGPDGKQIKISPIEANDWWRKNEPAGALLNNLMFLFIVVPIGLVLKRFYILSFLVFAFMVPYGLLVRHLAVRVIRRQLELHPEKVEEFQQEGIVSD
jgi:hypothetical protein